MTRTLKVSAIGKYPFITLSHENIDFKSLLVGKSEEKIITVTNSSLVPTSFTIEKVNDDGKDKSMHLSHTSGELIPGGYQKITITYTPLI